MPEPVQGTAVLRNVKRIFAIRFATCLIRLKKPHRDATQRHQDVALNRFNFCYNTLFLSAVFSESDGIRIDQLLKFRYGHCHAIGGILNADRSFF